MAEKILITTPEHVELEFTVAGIGSRFLAAVIDLLIQFGILIGFYIVLVMMGLGQIVNSSLTNLRFFDSVIMAVLTIVAFLVLWGYFVFFETRWNGQTPGKRKVGLRVIRDSGHPIDFRASFIRSVIRIVDWLPFAYLIGFSAMFFNERWKRLGDFAAGTLVVQEKKYTSDVGAKLKASAPKVTLDSAGFELLDNTVLGKISSLEKRDYQAIRHFLQRRRELDSSTQHRLASQISHAVSKKLNAPPMNQPAKFLEEVERAYRMVHGE